MMRSVGCYVVLTLFAWLVQPPNIVPFIVGYGFAFVIVMRLLDQVWKPKSKDD